MTRKEADEVAEATQDAYSFNAYSEKPWRATCRMLARRGYNRQAVMWIMGNEWTRWARDRRGTYNGNSAMVAEWLDSQRITPENWHLRMLN